MSDVKGIAFQRGMAMLRASGAIFAVWHNNTQHTSPLTKFALQCPDGAIVGDLEVVSLKQRRKPNGPRHTWTQTGYLEAVKSLQPGDVWKYQCCDKAEALGLQKAVTGRAAQFHGAGTCLSTVDYHTLVLEILRVE